MVKREYTKLSVYGWQRLLFNLKKVRHNMEHWLGFICTLYPFMCFVFKATHPDAQWGDPRAEAGLAPTQQPHHDQRRVLQDADVQGHR